MIAATDMNLADFIERLSDLTLFEIRAEWRRLHRMPPPMRLSRDLLIRAIAYKKQERAHGGLSKATLRRVARVADPNDQETFQSQLPSPISLKPGTILVREWHGTTHSVLVVSDGFEWRGQTYRSLTAIAGEITGAHWSGPRFFGLTKRSSPSQTQQDKKYVQG